MKYLNSILLFALILIVPNFVSADEVNKIILKHDNNEYEVTWQGETNWYFDGRYLRSTDAVVFNVKRNGVQWSQDNKIYSGAMDEIIYSTVTIYTDSSLSEVFFHAPLPFVMITGAEQVPETMVKTLVDGGLILTALVILAILLAVSLVRRFPSWFLR